MGTEYSVLHAADLAKYLPQQSRCMVALEPALEWSKNDHMQADIANLLKILVWQGTKDGQKGRNQPDMIRPPQPQQPTEEGPSADDCREVLSKARKEAR